MTKTQAISLSPNPVVVLGVRGGNYSQTSHIMSMDHQTPYLQIALGFVGLTDVRFIYAKGVASNQDGMETANRRVGEFANSLTAKRAA